MRNVTTLSNEIMQSKSFKERFVEAQVAASKLRLAFPDGEMNDELVSKLLLQGSVLALSEDVKHKTIAQKINALLHETKGEEQLVSFAIQILSSRLGNFPVISERSEVFGSNNIIRKLDQEDDDIQTFDPEIIGSLDVEEENARSSINNKIFHFNFYQKEILKALDEKSIISFSAPTSFGKSFIVRHHLARRFATETLTKALIIVPTKSLIDDFYESLLELKHNLELDFAIFTHARVINNVPPKSIFILTQERLAFLLEKNQEFVRSFQIVYCDEAQYISRGYRGFVLRSVLRKVIDLCGVKGVNGDSQYIFSSPLIKNPQYYKEKFFAEIASELTFHKEVLFSPVEKNIHFIIKSSNDFDFLLFRDPLNGENFRARLQTIGKHNFPSHLQGTQNSVEKEIARDINTVLSVNLSTKTILYTTSPLKAHQYAYELADRLPEKSSLPPQEIDDLRQYILDHYDENFGLIDLIKKGVGLHYGKMPVGLRRAVVKLFEVGHIDYLVCTSTLLEGVNLPAKNIFIFSNKHNGNNKHTTLSFWNLVGRAGRITYGLSGNVFCLANKAESYKDLFENRESEIKDPESEVSENITKRSHVITSFLDEGNKFEYLRSPYRNDIEYLIYELLTLDDVGNILDRFRLSYAERSKLLSEIQRQKETLPLSIEVLRKNPGIDPRLQVNLISYLREVTLSDLQIFLEIASNPLAINKLSLQDILNKTADTLRWPMKNQKYDICEKTAGRIAQWLHEVTISQFIQQALIYHSDISQLDRVKKALDIMELLDTEISYSAPKYLKCFYDFILYEARSRGLINVEEYVGRIEVFLFSIESGISSSVGKFLFERGISRSLAIKTNSLVEEISAGNIVDLEFFNRPEVQNKLRVGLSQIALNELTEHLEV